MSFRKAVLFFAFITSLTIGVVSFGNSAYEFEPFGPGVVYDVLDGRGPSGVKVDVIEWEGNLEFHVYPKGMLVGFTAKMEEKDKKKALVVGYRFRTFPNRQYVRRAVVSVPLRSTFNVFEDPTTDEYTKLMVTNHTLQGDVTAYKLDQSLIDMYPAGHPQSLALAKKNEKQERVPAAESQADKSKPSTETPPGKVDENGGIKFFNHN